MCSLLSRTRGSGGDGTMVTGAAGGRATGRAATAVPLPLIPADTPSTSPPPCPEALISSVPSPHPATKKRVPAPVLLAKRQSRPTSAHPMRTAPGPVAGSASPLTRSESPMDGSSVLAHADSTSPDGVTPEPSDDQMQSDTTGMTQMASGDPSVA